MDQQPYIIYPSEVKQVEAGRVGEVINTCYIDEPGQVSFGVIDYVPGWRIPLHHHTTWELIIIDKSSAAPGYTFLTAAGGGRNLDVEYSSPWVTLMHGPVVTARDLKCCGSMEIQQRKQVVSMTVSLHHFKPSQKNRKRIPSSGVHKLTNRLITRRCK